MPMLRGNRDIPLLTLYAFMSKIGRDLAFTFNTVLFLQPSYGAIDYHECFQGVCMNLP